MHWARLQCRARAAPLFLHAARHHLVGAATRVEILLQQPAQLRAEAASGLRVGPPRPIHHAHESAAEPDLSSNDQISRADAARSSLAAISKRPRALMTQLFVVIPIGVEESLDYFASSLRLPTVR